MLLVAERFLKALVIEYGKHPLSTDGGGTWYPQACRFLNIEHHIHSLYERSIIERTIQYIKDRTESFDDYFPCRKEKSKLLLCCTNLIVMDCIQNLDQKYVLSHLYILKAGNA